MTRAAPPGAAGHSGSRFSVMWFATVALLMSAVTPLWLISQTPLTQATDSAWVLTWVVCVLTGARYAWLIALGQRRLFELIFWLFSYVFLGLAPLVQTRSHRYPGTTPDMHESLNIRSVAVVALGSVAFAVGGYLATFSWRPRDDGRPGPVSDRRPAEVSPLAVSALSLVAVMTAVLYIGVIGVGPLFRSREARGATETAKLGDPTITALFHAGATLPLVVAAVGLLMVRDVRRPGQRRPFMSIALVLVLTFLLLNPISSARYSAGTAVLAVAVSLGITATPRRFRIFAVALPLALVFVFPYAAVARTESTTVDTSRGTVGSLASADFDAFDQINNTLLYVDERGSTNGRQLLGSVLFVIPRTVWPSKPSDTGPLIADFRQYRFTNLSEPLWAELFINGSWFGVAAGMLGLGAVVRLADRAATRRQGRPAPLVAVLPFYMIIILRGSLLQAMAGLFVILACSIVILRRPSRAGPVVTTSQQPSDS